jgi:hypothetical protein
VLVFDRFSWPGHKPWAAFVAAITVIIVTVDLIARFTHGLWLDGGSWLGLPCGIAAASICIFEFLLWPRKWLRTARLGRAELWMRAHIWLGLLALPLVLVHVGFGVHHASGAGFGGALTTTLALVFFAVIVSGIWGLAVQQRLPRRMLEELPHETIYAQIDHVGARLTQEAAYLVLLTCGPEPGTADPAQLEALAIDPLTAPCTDRRRAAGSLAPAVRRRAIAPLPNTEALRVFVRECVKPYLERGGASRSTLRLATQAANRFHELRKRLPAEAHPAVDTLERLCEQRRQFDRQGRLHFWLHNWLWLHLPLSLALMLLLGAHIVTCWIYW